MNKPKYIFLSYPLSPQLSAYGNGKRIKVDRIRKMENGDSSNNTELYLPTHFGTHIDFPYHFSNHGKKSDDYDANFFICETVQIVDISEKIRNDDIIKINQFKETDFNPANELVLLYTGLCKKRYMDEYWNHNPAIHPELAPFFRKKMPNLSMIGFDSISLTGWNYRELGKEAHKAFLLENDILVIEDMDLSQLDATFYIKRVVISPLRVRELEGAPITVIAEIESE
jgi:kynurenine formamidase